MATETFRINLSVAAEDDDSDRFRRLYPAVNEDETPLPRSWNPKDKFNYIGLSQGNLRVHYKGVGKTHKDAASVRATHPIPASCGIYYFEVKVISKGRDGYMGVGLSAQGVNMNRLPGWDKFSYGYHGDDGNSFCSSGAGQSYGPTFTTGDTIGCCVNLVDHTCFYTKNGINLGIAFTDVAHNLYPTVGLQTPGEVLEANFGQNPFVFNIEGYMKEWRLKTRLTIERFPVSDGTGEFQRTLHKVVSTYLVHHGYCSSAEAFSRSADQQIQENIESIRNRQKIQKLVLSGRIGEAIEATQTLYPTLLDTKPDLLFMLKCRQFVEMVNGTDSEIRSSVSGCGSTGCILTGGRSNTGLGSSENVPSGGDRMKSSKNHNESNHLSLSEQQHHYNNNSQQPQQLFHHPYHLHTSNSSSYHNNGKPPTKRQSKTLSPLTNHHQPQQQQQHHNGCNNSNNTNSILHNGNPIHLDCDVEEDVMNATNSLVSMNHVTNGDPVELIDGDKMDLSDNEAESCARLNGDVRNGTLPLDDDERMDVDSPWQQRHVCGGSEAAIERMLAFGRELKAMSLSLSRQFGKNEANRRALQDAFGLLAYSDPWSSPIGSQLLPVKREPVCAALNSAILELKGLPKQPPLELAISQARQCIRLMSKSGIGSCAFASLCDYLH